MQQPLVFGLLGYPLSHSYSPTLQKAALQAAGLVGDYRLFAVPPLPEGNEALMNLLQALRDGEVHGLNVTIPHKQAVIGLVDRLTSAARQIGAVNVLYFRNGALVGENTDSTGFLVDLQRTLPEADGHGKHALVLGAGGSARAVVYSLVQEGWSVTLAARQIEQARTLAANFPFGRVSSNLLNADAIRSLVGVDLVVNCTPAGMWPKSQSSPWPENCPLPAGASVYDLIYNPSETQLFRQARQAGLPAATGLGMLVEQAALSFKIWTGLAANREAMREAVEELISLSSGGKLLE